MSGVGARVGLGTRFRYDGQTVEVVEMAATTAGNEVVLKDSWGQVRRLALKELLFSDRAVVVPERAGPSAGDVEEIASVVLGQLRHDERDVLLERAEHVREVLSGYRSGSPELAREGEPRPEYAPGELLEAKYAAKAAELGVGARSVRRWVALFREHGEAGLVPRKVHARGSAASADPRWGETALEVMAEHTDRTLETTTAHVVHLLSEHPVDWSPPRFRRTQHTAARAAQWRRWDERDCLSLQAIAEREATTLATVRLALLKNGTQLRPAGSRPGRPRRK
ncbi:helix-turn-helix domain-containing protein [Streptomyces canus]|uniref:helix-turn-helix domain-containing protein n=1 Tax=Streptomyces canus TaxID=58343 RepID=UPI0030E54AA6